MFLLEPFTNFLLKPFTNHTFLQVTCYSVQNNFLVSWGIWETFLFAEEGGWGLGGCSPRTQVEWGTCMKLQSQRGHRGAIV